MRRVNPNEGEGPPHRPPPRTQGLEAPGTVKVGVKWRVTELCARSNSNASPHPAEPLSTLSLLYGEKVKALQGLHQRGSGAGRAGQQGRPGTLHVWTSYRQRGLPCMSHRTSRRRQQKKYRKKGTIFQQIIAEFSRINKEYRYSDWKCNSRKVDNIMKFISRSIIVKQRKKSLKVWTKKNKRA